MNILNKYVLKELGNEKYVYLIFLYYNLKINGNIIDNFKKSWYNVYIILQNSKKYIFWSQTNVYK